MACICNLSLESIATYLGVKPETVFTVTATLTTFFLGFLINHFIGVRNAFISRKITRKIIQVNLAKLIEQVENQGNAFNDIQKQLDITNLENFKFVDRCAPAAQVFSQIGYETSFKAFFTGIENDSEPEDKTVESFNQLWNSVRYVLDIQESSREKFETFMKTYQNLEEKRNNVAGKIQPVVEEAVITLNGKKVEHALADYIEEQKVIVDEFLAVENRTQPKPVQEYFQKLIALNRKHIQKVSAYESTLKTVQLNTLINEASMWYQNLDNYFKSTQAEYVHLYEGYMETQEKLKKVQMQLFKS